MADSQVRPFNFDKGPNIYKICCLQLKINIEIKKLKKKIFLRTYLQPNKAILDTKSNYFDLKYT